MTELEMIKAIKARTELNEVREVLKTFSRQIQKLFIKDKGKVKFFSEENTHSIKIEISGNHYDFIKYVSEKNFPSEIFLYGRETSESIITDIDSFYSFFERILESSDFKTFLISLAISNMNHNEAK